MKKETMINSNDTDSNLRTFVRAGLDITSIKPLFTFDSKFLLVVAANRVKLFSVASGEWVHDLAPGHQEPIISLQHNSKNFVQVITCSLKGKLVIWEPIQGIALKEYDLRTDSDVVFFHAPPSIKSPWFLAKDVRSSKGLANLYSFTIENDKPSSLQFVMKKVCPHSKMLAINNRGDCVASIVDDKLRVMDIPENNSVKRFIGYNVYFTCVQWHPTERSILACGDILGRIFIWKNVFKDSQVQQLHWHPRPVGDIAFSEEGNMLYSAGEESTLVTWNIDRADPQEYLARIGLPIHGLTFSRDKTVLACSQVDNSYQLIGFPQKLLQKIIVQLFHPLPRPILAYSSSPPPAVTTGLVLEPQNRLIALNGRPGILQFYSPLDHRVSFSLDVTNKNWIPPREEDEKIFPVHVEKVAFTNNGQWMATIESWDTGKPMEFELTLKFWKFSPERQRFDINTVIPFPHKEALSDLKFNPCFPLGHNSPQLVSASSGAKLKVWSLEEGEEGNSHWSCTAEDAIVRWGATLTDLDFSQDGSLLAAACNDQIYFWSLDEVAQGYPFQSHQDLTFTNINEDVIRQVRFGRQKSQRYLLYSTCSHLFCLDVILRAIKWEIEMNVVYLEAHPFLDAIAVFSPSEVFLFRAADSDPAERCPREDSGPIAGAVFVPKNKGTPESFISEEPWHQKSRLFYLNGHQIVLHEVAPQSDEATEEGALKLTAQQLLEEKDKTRTNFTWLIAENVVSDVKEPNVESYVNSLKELNDINKFTIKGFPPLSSFLGPYIFANYLALQNKSHGIKDPKEEETLMDVDESDNNESDSDEELDQNTLKKRKASLPADDLTEASTKRWKQREEDLKEEVEKIVSNLDWVQEIFSCTGTLHKS